MEWFTPFRHLLPHRPWTSCGRYIEISLILEVLEDLLISIDRLDVLKGNLILQCNRYSKIDYPKINSIKITTFSVNTKQKWIQKLLLLSSLIVSWIVYSTQSDNLFNFMSTEEGPFTVFAPVDEAFDDVNIPDAMLVGMKDFLCNQN